LKRTTLTGLATVLVLLGLAVSLSSPVHAQPSIPFDGLRLVYFSETTQVVQEKLGLYASGWAKLVFQNVSGTSAKMVIDANGTVSQNGEQQPEKFNATVDFPTDRDTLIFLRNGGQQDITIYAGPSGLTIPSLPGVTVDLTRTWNLHDKPLIRAPVGSFSGYRYHTAMKSLPLPVGGTVDLDFYASYEMTTQVLMAAEVWASISGFTEMIAHTELRETNLLSEIGPSECFIATATFGSELAPQVQFLRNFRDQRIQKTFAGSNFMLAFNLSYYSFSPTVASMVYSNQELRSGMQILLLPLITILEASSTMFGVLTYQPELAALFTGLAASAMIAVVYLWIPSILISRRYSKHVKRVVKSSIIALLAGIIVLAIAELLANSLLAAISSATIVLSNLALFAALPCILLSRRSVNR